MSDYKFHELFNNKLQIGDTVVFKKERFDFFSNKIEGIKDKDYQIIDIRHIDIYGGGIVTCLVFDDLLQNLPAHHFILKDRIEVRKNKIKNL